MKIFQKFLKKILKNFQKNFKKISKKFKNKKKFRIFSLNFPSKSPPKTVLVILEENFESGKFQVSNFESVSSDHT